MMCRRGVRLFVVCFLLLFARVFGSRLLCCGGSLFFALKAPTYTFGEDGGKILISAFTLVLVFFVFYTLKLVPHTSWFVAGLFNVRVVLFVVCVSSSFGACCLMFVPSVVEGLCQSSYGCYLLYCLFVVLFCLARFPLGGLSLRHCASRIAMLHIATSK
jgi:hypothetical protein